MLLTLLTYLGHHWLIDVLTTKIFDAVYITFCTLYYVWPHRWIALSCSPAPLWTSVPCPTSAGPSLRSWRLRQERRWRGTNTWRLRQERRWKMTNTQRRKSLWWRSSPIKRWRLFLVIWENWQTFNFMGTLVFFYPFLLLCYVKRGIRLRVSYVVSKLAKRLSYKL